MNTHALPLRRASGLLLVLGLAGAAVIVGPIASNAAEHRSVAMVQSDGPSGAPGISADGRFVAFRSKATNLVAGDTNGFADVFVRNVVTGRIWRVSVSSSGGQADGGSDEPSITAHGRMVTFKSTASNLVPGDTNGVQDVFVHNIRTGVTRRVSVSSTGAQANHPSGHAAISADGRVVAFSSRASNLASPDTNHAEDVFVRTLASGTTRRVSVSSDGAQGNGPSGLTQIAISSAGRVVAFDATASNLVSGDTNDTWDVFVRNRARGVTRLVSRSSAGVQGGQMSLGPSLSADGSKVVFASSAGNLVKGDHNHYFDIFVRNRAKGTTKLVSVSSTEKQGDLNSLWPVIAANGTSVAFWSSVSTFVGPANDGDAYVRHLAAGTTEIVNVASDGTISDNEAGLKLAISADGRVIAFTSTATNLVAGDTNKTSDIFLRNVASRTTIRVTGP